MAITRTAWTDDDGSGTSGTVINNAVKTELYNQIDAALTAAVAAIRTADLLFTDATYDIGKAGATRPRDGFFSRNLVIGGSGAAGASGLTVITNQNAANGIRVGTSADAAAGGFLTLTNAAGAEQGRIQATNSTTTAYLTTSDARLKHDRGIATDLSGLRALVVHDFTMTDDPTQTPDRNIFAQEAYAVLRRGITPGSDGDDLSQPWLAEKAAYVPDLIVGWQQHDATLRTLAARLAQLEARI
jgi:hypothetical protein